MFASQAIVYCLIIMSNFCFCMESVEPVEKQSVLSVFFDKNVQHSDALAQYTFDAHVWFSDKCINARTNSSRIGSVFFTPQHDSLTMAEVEGRKNCKISIYNLMNDEKIEACSAPDSIDSFVLSPMGNYLGMKCSDVLLFFNAQTGEEIVKYTDDRSINHIIFDPTEKYVATGARKKMLSIADIGTNPWEKNNKSFAGIGAPFCFNPTGTDLAATTSGEDRIFLIDTDTWKIDFDQVYKCPATVHTLAYSPCGCYLAVGTGDKDNAGKVLLFDTQTKESRDVFCAATGEAVKNISFDSSGQYIAIGITRENVVSSDEGEEVTVHMINICTEQCFFSFFHPKGFLKTILFNEQGNRFAIGLASKILMYSNRPITVEQLMMKRLIYLWFETKVWDKELAHIKPHDTDATNQILQCIANTFRCNFNAIQQMWKALPEYMQKSLAKRITTMICLHKDIGSTTASRFLPAVENGDIRLITILLNRGVNVNLKGKHSMGVLHLAVKHLKHNPQGIAIIKLLLDHGADTTAEDDFGDSPFMLASYAPW